MKTEILALTLLATGCASYPHTDSWTPTQKVLGGTSVALDVIDYRQTKAIIAQGGHENSFISKSIIGVHPSAQKIALYKAGMATGKIVIADLLSTEYRATFLGIESTIQLGIDASNAKTIGWKFEF